MVKITKPAVITFIPKRRTDKQGYELLILPDEEEIALYSSITTAIYISKIIEKIILLQLDQYMWLHRRFKTRPIGESSFY